MVGSEQSTTCSGRALLRSVSAHRSYRWVYKQIIIARWRIAEFLILNPANAALAALMLRSS